METKTDLNILFHPTKKHLKEVEGWLSREYKKTGEGFYCNWNTIAASYQKEQIAVVTDRNIYIGFATWYIHSGQTASIEITEIKLLHRRKGMGELLILNLFQHFLEQGITLNHLSISYMLEFLSLIHRIR